MVLDQFSYIQIFQLPAGNNIEIVERTMDTFPVIPVILPLAPVFMGKRTGKRPAIPRKVGYGQVLQQIVKSIHSVVPLFKAHRTVFRNLPGKGGSEV